MTTKTRQETGPATDCGVCGRPLVYSTDAEPVTCTLCGTVAEARIWCPEGHYVCDACHAKGALDVLREVVSSDRSTDAGAMLERAMAHPAVAMHGPEHHVLVPVVLVAAAEETGRPVPENALEKAIARASTVPGGWCGAYGTCGAAVGVGVAVSVLTGATPVTGPQRTLAMAATSYALSRMLDEHPRCCKRAARTAVAAGSEFLRERLGIPVALSTRPVCAYSARNAQCPGPACPYHVEASEEAP
jgi:LSD1 subclass zinc finger protein